MDEEIINVNLIWDYPVKWTKFKVLRDFAQNFFDSVGYRQWHQRFSYEIKDNILKMAARQVSFSYEWLVPIGASTKRDNPQNFAGFFGEGAKIASLCAMRDYGWAVEMSSKDWRLHVITQTVIVDGKELKSLAYKIRRGSPFSEDTTLTVSPFYPKDVETWQCVLLSFYYPENPLVGEEIWKSGPYAIHWRTEERKPYGYSCTRDSNGSGIIFANYQALGSFAYPLVVCDHDYKSNDRERSNFYEMDVVEIIKKVTRCVPADVAAKLLVVFRNRWRQYPKKEYDFTTYYYIVNNLAEQLATSPEESEIWKKTNPHLLVVKPVKKSDLGRYNKRSQALAWLRRSSTKYLLVQDGFAHLGYPTLEQQCSEEDGFVRIDAPKYREQPYLKCLIEVVQKVFPAILGNEPFPPIKIIRTAKAGWCGMAYCVTNKIKAVGIGGLKIRYTLPYIALKERLLYPEMFAEALSTCLHELAHMYGGEHSVSFSKAMEYVLDFAFAAPLILHEYQIHWNKIAEAKSNNLHASDVRGATYRTSWPSFHVSAALN